MMKILGLVIFTSFLVMSFSVNALQDVNRVDYQSEILDLLNQYGIKFDDCFPELPSDFPSLPDNYSELDDWIGEIEVNKWYHRKIPYYGAQLDEIFFSFKTEMSYFAVRVTYLYNEQESEYIIYDVNFYETVEGIDSELWHSEMIPFGVSDKSIREIDICKETPGFLFITIILSLIITVGILNHKKK